MNFQKGGRKCVTCGYDCEDERTRAFAEIKRLQNSNFEMGVFYNQKNMEVNMVKTKIKC